MFGYPEKSNMIAYYWTASGQVGVNNNLGTFDPNTDASGASVRCVYDEWYWGTDTLTQNNKATFTWGDRIIKNPEDDSDTTNH